MARKMVRAAVFGAAGRMGQGIISIISRTEGITLGGAVERAGHPLLGQKITPPAGLNGADVFLTDDARTVLPEVDVVIDFTTPGSTLAQAQMVAAHHKPAVIGTTGFSAVETEQLQRIFRNLPWVFSPNMSIGVNLMFKMVSQMAKILGNDYDVEIVEAHHRMKKDAPSGTALRLAQGLAEALGRDLEQVGVYARKGMIGERTPQEIGIQVIRAGDIVGDHTVLFAGAGERIEFTHRAHTRDTFASGAVRAALWVVDQPPNAYTMQDVLGLRGS